jgi:hypothetical protein
VTTPTEQPDYLAYQLRLWRVGDGERVTWRVSLKSARTREDRQFAGLDDLCDFLKQQTDVLSGSDGGKSDTHR